MSIQTYKIYSFKLTSGEEVIAKPLLVNNDYMVISMPVSIAPTPQGMQLVPSLFTSDGNKEYTIRTNSIAMYGETDESLANKYIEMTTGIKVPDKKIILG
jgi:hypothetical protein